MGGHEESLHLGVGSVFKKLEFNMTTPPSTAPNTFTSGVTASTSTTVPSTSRDRIQKWIGESSAAALDHSSSSDLHAATTTATGSVIGALHSIPRMVGANASWLPFLGKEISSNNNQFGMNVTKSLASKSDYSRQADALIFRLALPVPEDVEEDTTCACHKIGTPRSNTFCTELQSNTECINTVADDTYMIMSEPQEQNSSGVQVVLYPGLFPAIAPDKVKVGCNGAGTYLQQSYAYDTPQQKQQQQQPQVYNEILDYQSHSKQQHLKPFTAAFYADTQDYEPHTAAFNAQHPQPHKPAFHAQHKDHDTALFYAQYQHECAKLHEVRIHNSDIFDVGVGGGLESKNGDEDSRRYVSRRYVTAADKGGISAAHPKWNICEDGLSETEGVPSGGSLLPLCGETESLPHNHTPTQSFHESSHSLSLSIEENGALDVSCDTGT